MGKFAALCRPRPGLARAGAVLAIVAAVWVPCAGALGCDGKSYSFDVAVGDAAEAGGLTVRLDKAKLLDHVPDKYYISVKDEGVVLGEDIGLHQYDSAHFKTRCGTVSIGLDRKSMFSGGTLKVSWSYF